MPFCAGTISDCEPGISAPAAAAYEYARLIDQVKPRLVIGENVKGLLNHDEGRTLSVIVSELENLGYRVAYKVMRSQFLDVPQKRERLIIFGVRNDIASDIFFPVENYQLAR